MFAVIDYGMGNIKSVVNALEAMNEEVILTRKQEEIEQSVGIILPGVGAFGEGMKNLHDFGLADVLAREVLKKKKPYLGICLGLQFLAEKSGEAGEHEGLGWVKGGVTLIEPGDPGIKIPHMGWNNINIVKESSLFKGLHDNPVFYFVHSYHLVPDASEDIVTSVADHGCQVTASIQKDNIFATQFHPEKSQTAGLMVLKNFISYCKNNA